MDLSSEQLLNFLPTEIIECALGDKEEAQTSSKIREWILSPQIAPLESRIYTYMLSRKEKENSVPITLSDLFQNVNIEDEILKNLQEVTNTAYILPVLKAENAFDKYYEDVKAYLNGITNE